MESTQNVMDEMSVEEQSKESVEEQSKESVEEQSKESVADNEQSIKSAPAPVITRFSVKDLGDIQSLIAMPEVEKKEHVTVDLLLHMVTEYRFGKEETFPAIEMTHPFNPFSDKIRIEIKHPSPRGKFNERFTRLRENALQQGKDIRELTFTGVLSLKSFIDKRNRTKAEYVAIDIDNFLGENGGTLYARIADKAQNGAFVEYGKHYLKVAETEVNPDLGI